ncbi:TonB-dependent receptor [Flavobacterium sp. H122]|uniref:TonB-dependent receptor n=1 Tax=Flavobacterium sp. H122 TaxID=2529860 RepID=UPI0020C075CE|nr:TonB-dependent receptor [Flavobacterium sp. H122]
MLNNQPSFGLLSFSPASFNLSLKSLSSLRLLSICLLFTQFVIAQKKDDIGTEVVNVVKPYTPTISDAYKVKEVPPAEDAETTKKEEVKYQIFSFPVASTFVPAKGKAQGVEKPKEEKLWPNYATVGYGNYSTLNAELFVTHDIDENQYAGGMFRYLSSGGGIKEVELDDDFSEISIGGLYGYNKYDTSFKLDLGYKRDSYNWYGLPLENPNYTSIAFNSVDPLHVFNTFKVGSELAVSKSFFEKLNVNFIGFSDDYGSRENRFIVKPDFKFDFRDTSVKLKFNLDYANTTFDESYQLTPPPSGSDYKIDKSHLIFSGNPSFTILKDDLSIELGAEFAYLARLKNTYAGSDQGNESGVFIYPKIKASYKLVGDLMVFVAGAEGGLQQNTYENFASQNKFISPTLDIMPTDNQYNIYAGLNGKLTNSVAYNVKASYDSSKNKALFVTNPYLSSPSENYSYGNSFNVVYDNIKTISFYGELKADINKNIALGINGQLNAYNTDIQEEAWNLPTVKFTFTSDFNVGKKFYAGTQLFYVGERKDQFTNYTGFVNPDSVQTLEGYFDINAHIGYKHNERLNFFLKGNNLANKNYQRWLNYPVQGVQVMGGASYKFDF